jgi:arsenate reductase
MELQKHDMAKEPPMRELLERLIDETRVEDYLNRRSPAYKERNLASRKLTKKEAIDLMIEDPNLIRRPVVIRDSKRAIFGFNTGEYDKLK